MKTTAKETQSFIHSGTHASTTQNARSNRQSVQCPISGVRVRVLVRSV
jgi:hypothetical protein